MSNETVIPQKPALQAGKIIYSKKDAKGVTQYKIIKDSNTVAKKAVEGAGWKPA